MSDSFSWHDGERVIHFGAGAASRAVELLDDRGLRGFALLTTERTLTAAPALAGAAALVLHVAPGLVDELSAALLDRAGGRPLVALGGGRVVDTAKAIGGVTGEPVATLATTLSGAELTRSHRRPVGHDGAPTVRPALVIADPALMTGAPAATLAASAMNAMAHAMEALYTPYRSPVTDMAALRAATLLARGVASRAPRPVAGAEPEAADGAGGLAARTEPGAADAPLPGWRADLALGAVLAGYACGATKVAFHHAVCQTIVRTAGTPHAETNAVMLPHSARLMVTRAPAALGALAGALGDPDEDAGMAPGLLAHLAARSGHTRLRTLGVREEHVDAVVAAVLEHPHVSLTPDPPGPEELRALVAGAI